MTLFMAVTNDDYEVPIAVETSCQKLADVLGKSRSTVASTISHGYGAEDKRAYRGEKRSPMKYLKIEVEDEP